MISYTELKEMINRSINQNVTAQMLHILFDNVVDAIADVASGGSFVDYGYNIIGIAKPDTTPEVHTGINSTYFTSDAGTYTNFNNIIVEKNTIALLVNNGDGIWKLEKIATFESSGGSGGTSNYNELSNKPTINSVEIINNINTVDIGIQYTDILNTPNIPSIEGLATETYVNTSIQTLSDSLSNVALSGDYNELINLPTIPSIEGLATETYVDNGLNRKQNTLIPGANITIDPVTNIISSTGGGETPTTPNYNELDNKPSINSISLIGNILTSDLGINYSDISNTPSIPSVDGLATEMYVDDKTSLIDSSINRIDLYITDNIDVSISALDDNVAINSSRITTLMDGSGIMNAAIESIDASINRINEEITRLDFDTSTFYGYISTNDASINDINYYMRDVIDASINYINNEITRLDFDTSTFYGYVYTNDSSINDINYYMRNVIDASINTINNDIDSLQYDTSTFYGYVSSTDASINTINNDIDSLQYDTSTFYGYVYTNDSSINDINYYMRNSIDSSINDLKENKQNNLTAGTGINLTNDIISSSLNKYVQTFTNDDIVDNIVSFNHNKNTEDVIVSVYNNDKKIVIPTDIIIVDANNVDVDMTLLTPITGTYKAIIL